MNIEECKNAQILPKYGTLVTTKPDMAKDNSDWWDIIKDRIPDSGLFERHSGDGVYVGFLPGCLDIWWVTHVDGPSAVYSYDEVFDR